MKLIENNIIYLKEEDFFTDIINHAFLTRHKGKSLSPFDSLNLSYKVTDNKKSVDENYKIIKKEFNINSDFFLTNQVHSSNVIVLENQNIKDFALIDADAIITNEINKPIAIHTADCLPLLLFDKKNNVIGAAHAGWRGALNNITTNTVNAMNKAYGTNGEDIHVLIGPHNKKCCLEFDIEFANNLNKEYNCSEFFTEKTNKIHLNIEAKIINDLIDLKVIEENIHLTDDCTSCRNGRYFSYRKDNQKTGRQLSFIMLKE